MESLTIGPELENSQGQLSPSAVRTTQRLATAMPRNLTQMGCAGPRGLCARRRPEQVQQESVQNQDYSITSSARASNVGGTSRPSALAVLRLMASSNLVGCWTGRSAGLAPLKILST
jgi:hypothetical protein